MMHWSRFCGSNLLFGRYSEGHYYSTQLIYINGSRDQATGPPSQVGAGLYDLLPWSAAVASYSTTSTQLKWILACSNRPHKAAGICHRWWTDETGGDGAVTLLT